MLRLSRQRLHYLVSVHLLIGVFYEYVLRVVMFHFCVKYITTIFSFLFTDSAQWFKYITPNAQCRVVTRTLQLVWCSTFVCETTWNLHWSSSTGCQLQAESIKYKLCLLIHLIHTGRTPPQYLVASVWTVTMTNSGRYWGLKNVKRTTLYKNQVQWTLLQLFRSSCAELSTTSNLKHIWE